VLQTVLTDRVLASELLAEWNSIPLGKTFYEAQRLEEGLALVGFKWETKSTFSLAMVLTTSSGGVPRSSVMMENW
jgi:hypothetical protein